MIPLPATPPPEKKEARLLAPVQFMEVPPAMEVPEGVVHPSQNVTHNFTLDQEVEPDEADMEPLLIDQTGLKANPDGT